MRIDACVRFAPAPRRPLPEHLAPILARNRFDGCIAVQAAVGAQETGWLLELAAAHPMVRGVVACLDPVARLDLRLLENCKGVRCLAPPGRDFMDELAARGLSLELPPEARVAEPPPDLSVALENPPDDHLTRVLAGRPRVCCKLIAAEAPVRRMIELFGAGRTMFGSGWPTEGRTWKQSLAAFTQAHGPLPMEAHAALLGGTAERFYCVQ
jgi:L-fuconolactonase